MLICNLASLPLYKGKMSPLCIRVPCANQQTNLLILTDFKNHEQLRPTKLGTGGFRCRVLLTASAHSSSRERYSIETTWLVVALWVD